MRAFKAFSSAKDISMKYVATNPSSQPRQEFEGELFGFFQNLHRREIDGSQHGFAVHDDPQYAQSQTQQWQAHVIDLVTRWVARHSP